MGRLKIRLIIDNRRWHSFTPDIQSFWEMMVLLINLWWLKKLVRDCW